MGVIQDHVQQLLVIEPNSACEYFAVTVLQTESGGMGYTCFSGWVGYTDEKPRREIRQASLVIADRVVRSWRAVGQTALVVNTVDDLCLLFGFGGNAVVEKGVAEAIVPEWLAPTVVANVGEFGFAALRALPQSALNRAPTHKHRMQIIKRDGYRCRVCGRSPRDHVDLELHVHHIRPWAAGGLTEDSNLMTLCHTCHNGLEPHFEFSLYRLLSEVPSSDPTAVYLGQLAKYQADAVARWKEIDA